MKDMDAITTIESVNNKEFMRILDHHAEIEGLDTFLNRVKLSIKNVPHKVTKEAYDFVVGYLENKNINN